MVRSKVTGLVCWMYLWPNWLTAPPPPKGAAGLPAIVRHHGHADELRRARALAARGRMTFPLPAGYLRSTQQPPPIF